MRRAIGTMAMVIVGVAVVFLSVANRGDVTLRLSPFGDADAFAFDAPLYLVLFAAVCVGVLLAILSGGPRRRR